MAEWYIGLMSGSSQDGIDGVITDADHGFHITTAAHYPYSSELRGALTELCYQPSVDVVSLGQMDALLGELFSDCVHHLLAQAGLAPHQVSAIGCHGHTLFHQPDGALGFSIQIGDPNRIAQRTGIPTVADFRRRDVALGGQGAPLVPAFHRAVFQHPTEHRVVLNLGGIANITTLPPAGPVLGFDTGPGNTLLDAWTQRHLDLPFDVDGAWGAAGRVHHDWLERLLADPYFSASPPKSVSQTYFHLTWVAERLGLRLDEIDATDLQATLGALTASTIALAIQRHAPSTDRMLVCGGGAANQYLVTLLRTQLCIPVESTSLHGFSPNHVEAAAFAWLARQTCRHAAGNLPEVTGARTATILGAIYPANPRLP